MNRLNYARRHIDMKNRVAKYGIVSICFAVFHVAYPHARLQMNPLGGGFGILTWTWVRPSLGMQNT